MARYFLIGVLILLSGCSAEFNRKFQQGIERYRSPVDRVCYTRDYGDYSRTECY